jgi:hypothetical protein
MDVGEHYRKDNVLNLRGCFGMENGFNKIM